MLSVGRREGAARTAQIDGRAVRLLVEISIQARLFCRPPSSLVTIPGSAPADTRVIIDVLLVYDLHRVPIVFRVAVLRGCAFHQSEILKAAKARGVTLPRVRPRVEILLLRVA